MDGGPLVCFRGEVLPEWVDVNDHMNVSFFDRVFDAAEKVLFDELGIDEGYAGRTGYGVFRVEKFIRYEKELRLAHKLEVRSSVLWTDQRRIHHFHEIVNLSVPARSAFCDALSIHVDLSKRKAAMFHLDEVRQRLQDLHRRTMDGPRPPGAIARDFSKRRGA
ncbi:MAG TPA: thioesterase family protein [Ensifer sp.]|nr:thioesterase family protein [Ensifer sp.]